MVTILATAAVACSDQIAGPPTSAEPGTVSASAAQAGEYSPALNSSIPASVEFRTVALQGPIGGQAGFAINDAGLIVGAVGGNGIAAVWSDPRTSPLVLGNLDGSTNCCSHFFGVNALGDVVGNSNNAPTNGAQMWIQATGERRFLGNGGLPNVIALDINDHRDVVGEASFRFPIHIDRDGTFRRLSTGHLTFGTAGGINNSGAISGRIYSDNVTEQAVVWPSKSAAPVMLPGAAGSSAWSINEAGDLVGRRDAVPGVASTRYAVLWPATGGEVDLRTWPNPCSGPSEARSVNDIGVILGRCNGLPVLWTAAEGMRLLPGNTETEPHRLNNRNQAVGRFVLWEPTNSAPFATVGGPYSANEGSPIALALGGTDPDGDALSYSWNLGDGTSGTGPTPPAGHTYADNGIYAITLTVTDPSGASDIQSTTATIANVAPALGSIAAPLDPVARGTPVHVSAPFSDPGTQDTHGAVVDWGDGSSTEIALGSAASPVAAPHSYGAAGVYRVTVTLTDKDGGADERVFEYIVVYDADAGFVTGGGWIASPAGACQLSAACADAVGKAHFGFVARYQRGANQPDGNTQFQFKAGLLDFQSRAYEWMVVAGARAQFKGVGHINGAGEYGFLLTAIDGQLNGAGGTDRFRIKIWDRASGTVVYDNQAGESEASDAATALGGGSIVIHR